MGACATKPNVDAGNASAPEAEPATENKAEAKNVVVDAVVAVESENKLEVLPEEVAGEGNQSDKGKELLVDEDKVDHPSFKRRSLSNLFKEKEGGESIEFEGLAEETETLKSKGIEKDTKEAEIKVPQTEVDSEKCSEGPETKAPQTIVETKRCIEEPESKTSPTVVETIKHIEEAEINVPQAEVKTEKCTEEPETKAPQTVVETKKCIELETKALQTVVEAEKCVEEPESKTSQTVVETVKCIKEAEIKVSQIVVEPEKHTEEVEPKAPPIEVDTEKYEVTAEKIAIPDVLTTSETILEEKVIVTSLFDVSSTSVTLEEKKSEEVKVPKKVEKPETMTLVEETPPKDESKTSKQKKEDIRDVGKTEMETPKETEPKFTPTETSIEPALKHDEVKVTSDEKVTS